MTTATVRLSNADRMITQAEPTSSGVVVTFADGRSGVIPWSELPEIGALSKLEHIELPSAYMLILVPKASGPVEVPWDFARHFCDARYRPRVEKLAKRGRVSIGKRIRELREEAELTQAQLASRAGIGRITLVRIEGGQRSPRYETLASIANALGTQIAEVVTGA